MAIETIQRKSGDECGKKGWWIDKETREKHFVPDVTDKIPPNYNDNGEYKRRIWIYAGDNEPSEDEINNLITTSPDYP